MALALSACVLQAGPLEDAEARLKAGKPEEVDGLLAALLELRPAPREALLLSFEAAAADGRLYTAERRALAVLEAKEPPPADFLFQAAGVAGALGKTSVQQDRLTYFLQLDQGATPEVQAALVTLCKQGATPALFARYVQQFGTGPEALDLGLTMLRRMREGGKPADFLKLLGTMLAQWQEPLAANRLFAEMHAALNGNVFGLDVNALFDLRAQHRAHDPSLLAQWSTRSEWTPQRALELQEVQAPELLPPGVLERVRNINGVPEADRPAFAGRLWALETLFRASQNPWYSRLLFETVVNNPTVFLAGNKPSVDNARLLDLTRHVLAKTKPGFSIRNTVQQAWTSAAWDDAQREALATEFPEHMHEALLRGLYGDAIVTKKDVAGLKALIRKSGDRPEVRWAFFDTAVALGDKELITRAFHDRVYTDAANFDIGSVRAFLGNPVQTVEERVAAVNACFQETGYTPAWKRVADERNLPLAREAAWQTFVATIQPGAKAGDAFVGALVELSRHGYQSGGKGRPQVPDIVKRAVAAFDGTAPDATRPCRTAVFEQFLNRYRDIIRDNRDACREGVALVLPKLGKGGNFAALADLARRSQDSTALHAVAKARLATEGDYVDGFNDVLEPEGSTEAVHGRFYAQMGAETAADYVTRNLKRWTPPAAARELASLLRTFPVDQFTESTQVRVMDGVLSLCATPDCAALLPLEPLAIVLVDDLKGSDAARERLLQAHRTVGTLDVAVARYLAAGQKLPPVARQRRVAMLLNWIDAPGVDTPLLRPPKAPEPPAPTSLAGVTFGAWTEACNAVPPSQLGLTVVSERHLRHLEDHRNSYGSGLSPALGESFDTAEETAVRALAAGATLWGAPSRVSGAAVRAVAAAAARGDKRAVSRLCRTAGRCFDRGRGGDYKALLEKLAGASLWECAYTLADQTETDDPAMQSLLGRLRADAAAHMPGVYPVPENDPAYPLFVAADELQRRNAERAWGLLRANVRVFERDPLRYPPQFVAWAVEQFRIVRGDRDALQGKAKVLIDGMLAKEQSLPPELAASLMLTRAEIARDRRLFDAARLEYQAIRNHPTYQKTPAGRQAMFRDVDLMVTMGNASGVEQTVEHWMSVPDPEVQAQAHFVLARLAFDRQDYDETRRQLDLVFAIDFTHTEARLLHGKWKLATNYEVDDTQVLVGDLADRRLIRPGQPLTITVQDRNLGVAGGGATIPVIVTTSGGGDRETLALYPSTRDPFLFRGTIETALATATAGNHVLDVRGEETVSYAVDAAFLKARGLVDGSTKELRVVDDAVMAVGAAVPDAEEGRPEAELERELAGEAFVVGAERTLTRNLRPGSPVHVAVRDRDRSLTPAQDTVVVSAATSSGDSIEKVALTESEAFTGVFRGAIPTRLPPPRASASDSASGVNPGDTINRRHADLWRSLPDGRKGKWLDVDTMGSHLVASASLTMPHAGDIALLRLYGRLAGGEQLLGSYPGDRTDQRGGIQVQSARAPLRDATDIRRHLQSTERNAKRLDDWIVESVERHTDQRFLVSGAICPPEPQRLRLRFAPASDVKNNRALNNAWVQLVVDGREVFRGSGQALLQQVVVLDLDATPHLLEVFAGTREPEDAFRLALEQDDGKLAPIPAAWTDPTQQPALAEFLSDKATLERGADGFTATFEAPLRLRALRWEFTDFAGNDVAASALRIVDAEGKEVIPCDDDFSEALGNDTLEVAPGDRITVTYLDEETSRGEKRIIERTLDSSFHDATVSFLFEALAAREDGRTVQQLHDAYRFQVGDAMFLRVEDPDMDVTPGADSVTVRVTSKSGTSLDVVAVEQRHRVEDRIDGGVFLALLRTVITDDATSPAAAPKDALPVVVGEGLTALYFDRENTQPGIPVERTASVQGVLPTTPAMILYHAWSERTEDKSDEAKVRLAQIRRRPGNEKIDTIWRDVYWATEMSLEELAAAGATPVNAALPIPISVDAASHARHAASVLNVEAVSVRELKAAEAEGREPAGVTVTLSLDGELKDLHIRNREDRRIARVGDAERFSGLLHLRLGDAPVAATATDAPALSVSGSDEIRLRVLDEKGQPQLERRVRLVSGARVELTDSTYGAERKAVHLGERFHIVLDDPDRDATDAQDTVAVDVAAEKGGHARTVTLTETMPHSGRFTGGVRPVFFGQRELPAELGDQLPVAYGDTLLFRYQDDQTLPLLKPGVIEARGTVYQGADGQSRVFSKRFRDADQAVLVQFRLAECLFETAKEHRRLKQPEKSAAAIAEGREILEAALRDYPGTGHAAQGEYLLANLYQELAAEQKQAGAAEAARTLYQEALARFSALLATWPEGEHAARAQYHKALCLEMLEDYPRASEEYVKMTYLFPESPLVGDAAIRLATYYYTQEQRYDTAGRIYANFQRRFPAHPRAPRALFMGAQCHIKQAEMSMAEQAGQAPPSGLALDEYRTAIEGLTTLVDTYKDSGEKELRAQALYWAGDASFRIGDYPNAYLFLKRTVFEYPETEWARRARDMLVQETKAFETLE
jgi:TolA-binding protein